MTAAETIAAFATSITLDEVPEAVVEHAKLHILDALGCGLAAHATGNGVEGRATMRELGGEGQATVIGLVDRLPAVNAAFANAMICHGLDFDDTHSDSGSHISTVIAPAAFAAAELYGAGGSDVLAAIVAGNEVVCRVGMAAPGAFHARGFHPTAICGVFGATAAVSRLAGLDAETATRALGIAGSMASGIFAYLADGTPTKPIHAGWAAHGALIATRLAHHGAAGPRSVFDAQFGIYHTYLGVEPGSSGLAAQLADLGSRWETPRIAYKPFPICHFTHGAVGAAREAVEGRTFAPDEIAEVVVSVPEPWVPIVLEPAGEKKTPRTEYEGKFSLQYTVASMLVRGHVGVTDFTEAAIADPDVLAVAAKVSREPRDFATYPEAFPGAARVVLASGETHERELPYQKGAPENPWAADDVRTKFRANAELALPADSAAALEEAILALDQLPELTAALAPLTLREAATV
jgi:2-methylcitrate dehydratase PrpD